MKPQATARSCTDIASALWLRIRDYGGEWGEHSGRRGRDAHAMTLDDRLENWAVGYRDRMRQCTTSAFWAMYGSSPQREHWEYGQAPPVERPGVNWADAAIINGAWQAIPDLYHQTILGGWYVRKWSPALCARIARKAKGDRERAPDPTELQFAAILRTAHGLLERQLDLPAVFRMERVAERVRKALDLVEWRRMEARPLDSIA